METDERVTLRDGSELAIRPVAPDDKPAILSGFERMSPQSRYRRFFAPVERLTESDLAYLTEVDHHDHEALIGFDPRTRDPVGVARYVRGAEPEVAEVSVAVTDDWQRRGVASALLERLALRAREEGITHFAALVMSDNREAIDLFESLAPHPSPPKKSASGHLELFMDVPDPGGRLGESRLGRALRAAARGTVTIHPWRVMRESIRRRVSS